MFVESCSGEESNESLVPKVVKEVGGFYFVLVFCVCVFVLDSEYPRVFNDPVRELLWRPDVSDESARMEKKKKRYLLCPVNSESTDKNFVLFFSVILECCAYLLQLHE